MIVLVIMYMAANHYIPALEYDTAAVQLHYWLDIVAPVVLIVLMSLAVYLWINNKKFTIALTPTSLSVDDPLFTSYAWSVRLSDIISIVHQNNIHNKSHTRIDINLTNGDTEYLTMNYGYSRTKLYAGIAKHAPHVILPKRPNFF